MLDKEQESKKPRTPELTIVCGLNLFRIFLIVSDFDIRISDLIYAVPRL